MGWKTNEYKDWLHRQLQAGVPAKASASPDRESDLHQAILDYCRARGWGVVHSRMDRRATLTPGAPDFIIYANGGRVITIEAKRKGGKLSPAQRDFAFVLSKNGHEAHVVTGMEEFEEITRA